MRKENKNRMDSSLNIYEASNGGSVNVSRTIGNVILNSHRLLVWTLVIGTVLIGSSGPAFGQFTIQPMKLDLQVTPGKQVVSALEIQNVDPNQSHVVDFSIVELNQGADATWQVIEPNDITDPNSPYFKFDLSTLSSCKSWIALGTDSVTVSPLGMTPVPLTVRVPRGKRGFFCAGILASIRPRPGVSDVALVLRFLVPVIIEIQGRPMRNMVEATDVGMEYIPSQGTRPSTTILTMNVVNSGVTFPRLNPVARIWAFSSGHWKVLSTATFQETGIIPGAKISIKTNLNKPLPSGRYKVAGVLYVDSTRTKRVEKEIDFVGDTAITKAAADAPLDLFPSDIIVENLPGATRTASLKVYNGANETINVKMGLELPPNLQGVVYNGIKGIDLDCSRWLRIEPQQFTLRGEGGMQTINIIASMPQDATTYPSYYSILNLFSTYPDGQNAGVTPSKICVHNQTFEAAPEARATKLVPTALSESKYLIAASFFNSSIVHFKPIKCQALATMGTETVARASASLNSTQQGLMLPFEDRNFSGIIDLASLPAELYRLSVGLEYAPGVWATKQIAIRVNIEGNKRVIDIIGMEEELPQIIEVQWSKVPDGGFFAKE